MNISVRSLYHMILENVCMDVCGCACVRACVRTCVCVCVCECLCVCARIPFYLRIYAVAFNRVQLIFFCFFYSEFGKKIIFYDSPISFCFMLNFRFSNNLFLIFFNDRTRIFELGGRHSKEHKKSIFYKKNYFSNYRGSFVITKNVFLFLKANNS